MEKIILASVSPRRKQILKSLGIPFYAFAPPFDEVLPEGTALENAAEYCAVQKAQKTAHALQALSASRKKRYEDARFIAAADTLIVHEGTIFGKPQNEKEAFSFLKTFSGKTHSVYSGIAVYSRETERTLSRTCISRVSFAPLFDHEIRHYLTRGEWRDAAGAYKIQGGAQCFICRIEGSYSSIVGLPIFEFYEILKKSGYRF